MNEKLFYVIPEDSDISHHGVIGMKWGVRRYQNPDGSLTERGRRRYGIGNSNGMESQIESRRRNSSLNKNGTSPTAPFGEGSNIRIVNKILKDTNNCSFCTFAYDLRKRGIDVRAGGNLNKRDGATQKSIASWYEGNRQFKENNYIYSNLTKDGCYFSDSFSKTLSDGAFKREILSQGDGTSGHLALQNVIDKEYADFFGLDSQFLGSHDVFYQVENGEIYIIDAQSREKVPYDEYINTDYSEDPKFSIKMYPTDYLRTDDLEPNVIIDNGKLLLSPINKNGEEVVKEYNTPMLNYSPPYKHIDTKPLNYSPPYKSKNEFQLMIEDGKELLEQISDKVYNSRIGTTASNIVEAGQDLWDDIKFKLWRFF